VSETVGKGVGRNSVAIIQALQQKPELTIPFLAAIRVSSRPLNVIAKAATARLIKR